MGGWGLGGEGLLVDEVGLFGVVDVDLVGGALGLPVGGEDDDGGGFYFLADFFADGLEDGVGGVGGVVLHVGLGGVLVFSSVM